MVEIITKRTEFSKTYNIGKGKYRSDISCSPRHYREDYSDSSGYWLDADYSPEEDTEFYTYNKIPNIIIKVYKNKIGYEVQNRRTKQKFIVELDGATPDIADVDFRHEVNYKGIRLWTILKTGNVKKLLWRVTETDKEINDYMLEFNEVVEAFDSDGDPAKINTVKVDQGGGIFTWEEEFTGEIVDSVKPPVYPVEIDADVVVTSSTDDCYGVNSTFSTSSERFNAGAYDVSYPDYYSAARFQLPVPQGATITACNLRLECSTSFSGTDCRTKIDMEDADNAATFSNKTNYDARSRTTAKIDWDISTVWSVGNYYNSDDFASVMQEVVNRSGYIQGNYVVVFWEDDGSPTTANNLRRAGSYDSVSYDAPMLQVTWTGGDEIEIEATKYGLFNNNWDGTTNESPPNLGRYQRDTSYVSEVLCDFDMSELSGTVVSAVVKFTVTSYRPSTPFNTVYLYEQDKTAPGSWSNPPIYDDFAASAWATLLNSIPSIRDAGEYWIQDSGDNIKDLVQSWIDTPSSNWGMILSRTDSYYDYYLINISSVKLVLTGVSEGPGVPVMRRRRGGVHTPL